MKQNLLKLLTTVLILLFIGACSNTSEIDKIVDDYHRTYVERVDFENFMSFYSDDIVFEDMINGDKIVGKLALKNFFDWHNPAYKKLQTETLIIEEKLIDESKVVFNGYFTPFQWGETKYEAMHFTTILTFNSSGKIVKQVDWINYPNNLVDYQNRKNSNNWIELNDL